MSDIARNQVETSGAKRSNPRTCVGCKKRDAKANLVKVVAVNGELIFDPAKSIPGRGAWIHSNALCAKRALERNAFPRALRIAKPEEVNARALLEWLAGNPSDQEKRTQESG